MIACFDEEAVVVFGFVNALRVLRVESAEPEDASVVFGAFVVAFVVVLEFELRVVVLFAVVVAFLVDPLVVEAVVWAAVV